MNYWIFKTRPAKPGTGRPSDGYRIDERLADPNPIVTWQAKQHAKLVEIGDVGFVYRTRSDQGIVAIVEVTALPAVMGEIESEYPYAAPKDCGPVPRMLCRFVTRFDRISRTEILNHPGLGDLETILDREGTNFPITPAQGQHLQQLVDRTARVFVAR